MDGRRDSVFLLVTSFFPVGVFFVLGSAFCPVIGVLFFSLVFLSKLGVTRNKQSEIFPSLPGGYLWKGVAAGVLVANTLF